MLVTLIVSSVLSWAAVIFLAFMILGVLRTIDVVRWQLQQVEMTTPSRLGRGGLKPGKKAPEFNLPSVSGGEISLASFTGRQVFLVFVQTGCGPCHAVVPDLNRVHARGEVQVLAINNADAKAAAEWTRETASEFPVLMQERWKISKRYQVMATPFAFLIDEKGVIKSNGVVSTKQHIRYVLEGRRDGAQADHVEVEDGEAETASAKSTNGSVSHSHTKEELEHV